MTTRRGKVIELAEVRQHKRERSDAFRQKVIECITRGVVTPDTRLTRRMRHVEASVEDLQQAVADRKKCRLESEADGPDGFRCVLVWTTIDGSVLRVELHVYDHLQGALSLVEEGNKHG